MPVAITIGINALAQQTLANRHLPPTLLAEKLLDDRRRRRTTLGGFLRGNRFIRRHIALTHLSQPQFTLRIDVPFINGNGTLKTFKRCIFLAFFTMHQPFNKNAPARGSRKVQALD